MSAAETSQISEYVLDGNAINKTLEAYNLEAVLPTSQLKHMLPGQVFELLEKKFTKAVLDEIEKSKAQQVRLINLEALSSGPHKEYVYAISGALENMIATLIKKNVQVTGTIQDPFSLPWSLVSKIDPKFRGIPAPGQNTPP